MALKVKKASGIGFCFGVKRAINVLEKVAGLRGKVETLGAVVHNRQVMNKLAEIGITVADSLDELNGDIIALGAHGVGPQVEEEIRSRNLEIINCTCSFVHRAQVAAQQLAQSGFFIIIYGDADHPEVRGIMDWAGGKGIATLDENSIIELKPLPRRLGILSQTTQIPANFTDFTKKVIDIALAKDAEIRIIDTICHDIRERQQAALELAKQVDIMIVIGSRTSANTKHLTELCATVTRTELIETAEDIQSSWFQGNENVGVTSGASTSEETINEVLTRLEIIM